MLKKAIALLLCLMMLISVTAFAEDEVLLVVNGTDVMRSRVDFYLDYYTSYYTQQGYDVSGADAQASLRQGSVDLCVQTVLLAQHAAEDGCALTEEEIAAATLQGEKIWDSFVMQLAGEVTEENREELLAEAEATLELVTGYTRQTLVEEYLENASYDKAIAFYAKTEPVTDEAVKQYYEEMAAQEMEQVGDNIFLYEYYSMYGMELSFVPAGYRAVQQILLSVDEDVLNAYSTAKSAYEDLADTEDAAPEEVAALEEQMLAARVAVLASVQDTVNEIGQKFAAGTAFEALIDEYNTDPGMADPQTRAEGYLVHKDSIIWDPSFIEAAMSIENVGEMSEPAVGVYGVYICYYLKEVPAGAKELSAQTMEELRTELEADQADQQSEAFSAVMNEWYETAEIVYTEAGTAYLAAVAE